MNAPSKIDVSLIGALAKALPELESAKKNKANPAFKSKYADLAAVIHALEPIREHGLWYRQHSHEAPDGAMIETFYIHESGEQLSAGTVFMPASKKDAHGFGSALSYCRRYGLQTAFGLATEDDDGNAATKAVRNGTSGDIAGERQISSAGPDASNEPNGIQQVSEADLAKIKTLCSTIGGGQATTILEAYHVTDLPELNVRQAAAVIKRLNEKLADKVKAESNAKAKESADV